MKEKENQYRMLVREPEGRRPIARIVHRWVDNIKITLRVRGWCGIDWIDLAQDRDRWTAR
jgi:hypothetical protein